MMKRFLPLLAMITLSACGTSPDPSYFSLKAEPGSQNPAINPVIKIQRPILAGYLDRPEFVQQDADLETQLDDMNRWAEPVDEMFTRILAADVQQRLPTSVVLTEGNSSLQTARYVVAPTLAHFNQSDNGVTLDGELLIKDQNTQQLPQRVPLHLTAESGSSPEAVASSLSQLVAQTADLLAKSLMTQNPPIPMVSAK